MIRVAKDCNTRHLRRRDNDSRDECDVGVSTKQGQADVHDLRLVSGLQWSFLKSGSGRAETGSPLGVRFRSD